MFPPDSSESLSYPIQDILLLILILIPFLQANAGVARESCETVMVAGPTSIVLKASIAVVEVWDKVTVLVCLLYEVRITMRRLVACIPVGFVIVTVEVVVSVEYANRLKRFLARPVEDFI